MPKALHKSISFKAQQDAELRTESMYGRDYLVVPVVALVQGVLQGMNSDFPELALAEEFGKVPQGWDGRPVVMGHPVVNGTPVSANSPAVLQDYAFGQLFNTRVEDDKLKTEAWIDLDRVNALGGEVESTIERLKDGTVVEVSTGLFTGVEESSGRFNGRDYKAVWRGIVPDHLAFLSEGVKGACSVEDGCGTPRVNAQANWQEFKMSAGVVKASSCGCGGHDTPPQQKNIVFDVNRFLANAFPEGLLDQDVRKLLAIAVNDRVTNHNAYTYAYVIGFTSDKVVYETYSSARDCYVTMQCTYSIGTDNTVTLGDDEEEVLLTTKIMPANPSPEVKGMSTEKSNDQTGPAETTPVPTQTPAPTETETSTETPEDIANNAKKAKGDPKAKGKETDEDEPEMKDNVSKPVQRTMSEYLADMPAEMQEVFQSGLRLHTQRKADLVTSIKASGRCKFSDDTLKSMGIDMLENLAELANVPNYAGTATPKANASADDDLPPAPPALFPVKA